MLKLTLICFICINNSLFSKEISQFGEIPKSTIESRPEGVELGSSVNEQDEDLDKIIHKKKKKSKKKIKTIDLTEEDLLAEPEELKPLTNYDKEKALIEQEIIKLSDETSDMTIKEKKKKFSKKITYETSKMRRFRSRKSLEEIPVEMREPTDIVELKIK